MRPWGEKTERYLRNLCQNNKLIGLGGTLMQSNIRYGSEYLKEALGRTIAHCVENFDATSLSVCKPDCVGEFFPSSISKYVENEESRAKFLVFMARLCSKNCIVFAYIFLNDNVREELLTVMDESIRSIVRMQCILIHFAMGCKELFESLKSRGLLKWRILDDISRSLKICHLEALKWIEENGIGKGSDFFVSTKFHQTWSRMKRISKIS